ncbi:MAG TPA: Zn-ribbon domain-containing OB-fold protein [candidate division Zixibacteria bacterium]|nr:Zn-ribbon domain-containing OB-fold protein [candidate division Zixibacteria bacterium]
MSMFSARNWREYPQRYRMEASKFKKSGKTYFPPRDIDPETGDTEYEIVRLPDTGKLVTYTVIRVAPNMWGDEGPYALGIAELADGTRVMAQITDCNIDDVKIGMEIRVEFRRIQTEGHSGVLSYGYKFTPKWF